MTPISNELFQACQRWANEPGKHRNISVYMNSLTDSAKIIGYDYSSQHCFTVADKSDLPSAEECRKFAQERLKRELEELDK